jgi:phage terminase small subunit
MVPRNIRGTLISKNGELMGIDDLINQGKDLFEQNKDKINDALKSEQAEDISDKVLDGASDFAKKVAPDQFDAQIDGVRDNIDKSVGNE